MTGLRERIARPGPKRMLALDGGGVRGLITIEILDRLESLLREATGAGEDFVLADYFDYIGGTSTGAILAASLALGLPVKRLREFYLEGGNAMFARAPLFTRFFYYRNIATQFTAKLRRELRDARGEELTLGSDELRTLLLVVMRNESTNSPWPLSNNPYAKYNGRERPDCNLRLPLWQLVRASTAAPTFFPAEEIKLDEKLTFTFVDGACTVYNNPAFLLFLMATLPEYRVGWETGEDKLLLVSVGTGALTGAAKNLKPSQMTLLYSARAVPAALIDAALNEQDLLCRVFGRCLFGDPLDSEIGDLIHADTAKTSGAKHFTYVRYNPVVSADGLERLGLSTIKPEHVQILDSADHMPEMMAVGKAYARRIELAQFGAFAPQPAARATPPA